jgi:MarR family transcriptional regulator, 2-MHQ and catechol-resistance regulon repressor
LTIVHLDVYYPRVHELSTNEAPLDDAVRSLVAVFHTMPRGVPPAPARDLTLGQIRLLFLLRLDGPLPMGRIAEVFELSSTAGTGFVQRIERHGLVVRQHRSDDRRVVECALTEDGRRFLDELSGIRLDALRRALGTLDPDELLEFRRLLGVIRGRAELPT